MDAIVIDPPQTLELTDGAHSLTNQANIATIESTESYQDAAELKRAIRMLRKTIDGKFKEPVAQAYAAHRSMIALKKQVDDPMLKAETTITNKMRSWDDEQDRLQREEEKRLRDEQLKAEEERQAAEAKALAEAEKLSEAGNEQAADAVLDAVPPPTPAPVPVAPRVIPKTPGVTPRHVWKFEIVSPDAIPREFLIPDDRAIQAIASSRKENAVIPGVRFYSEISYTTRTI